MSDEVVFKISEEMFQTLLEFQQQIEAGEDEARSLPGKQQREISKESPEQDPLSESDSEKPIS